jgi:hypothetical protein
MTGGPSEYYIGAGFVRTHDGVDEGLICEYTKRKSDNWIEWIEASKGVM